MAHTNSTTNYNLPQFLPTDKPAWLVDVNPAYAAIDTAIKNVSDAAGAAQTDATQALSDAAGANAIATQANSKAEGAIASLSEQFLDTATYTVGEYVIFNNILYVCTEPVTTPGPWTGSVNWARASLDSIATELRSKTGSDIPVSDSESTTIADAIDDVNESLTNLGETSSVTGTIIDVPSSTFTTINQVTLPKGSYVLTGTVVFPAGATGNNIIIFSGNGSEINNNANNSVLAQGRCTLEKTLLVKLDSPSTYYLRAYQNSGSQQTISSFIKIMQIR